MTKKEILFVTNQDETFEEGLSYAIYLAGMMKAGLRVILLAKKSLSEKFDDLMTAVTFSEAGESETAKEHQNGIDPAHIHVSIKEQCSKANVEASIHTRLSGSPKVVEDFLNNKNVEMVLLSPPITKSGKFLKKLVKDSTRPVVTMSHMTNLAGHSAN